MASSNYTSNLHLCAWEEGDRPKRADFVSDNNIIDTQLGSHLSNDDIHVTSDEKAKINNPFGYALYVGSGEAERTITLGFLPKFAIIFKRGVPPTAYVNGVNVVNSGYAVYGSGGTAGMSIGSTGIVVHETPATSDEVRVSLNEEGAQYTMVAFK